MTDLTDEQRAQLLVPCVCGHTINDHGGYVACWLCEDEGGECHTPFEAILAERIARMVADAEQRGRAEACEEVDDRALMQAEERGRAIGQAEVAAVVEAIAAEWERDGGAEPFAWNRLRARADEVTP